LKNVPQTAAVERLLGEYQFTQCGLSQTVQVTMMLDLNLFS
jgi:hypothetical protein